MPTPTSIYIESGAGQAAQVLHAFLSPIVARVRDENGNFMAGVGVTFTLPQTPSFYPSGFFGASGTNNFVAFTDADGRGTSAVITANEVIGAWSGSVAINGFAISTTFGLANGGGDPQPTTVQITANKDQAAALNSNFLAVTARLLDQYGAGVAGQSLSMTVDPTYGLFVGGGTQRNVVTDASGNATFTPITASANVGQWTPQVSSPALVSAFANFTNVDAAVPTNVAVYSGSGQNAPLGALFAAPLVARVANALNGPVAGIAVLFDAPNAEPTLIWDTPPSADPATGVSDINGLATSPLPRAGAVDGTYNVNASAGALTPRIFQMTNGGAPPVTPDNALFICEV